MGQRHAGLDSKPFRYSKAGDAGRSRYERIFRQAEVHVTLQAARGCSELASDLRGGA